MLDPGRYEVHEFAHLSPGVGALLCRRKKYCHWIGNGFGFFLEVERAGQIRKASKQLRLNQATVARQLTAFERGLSTKLLERYISDCALTPAGEALAAAAERAEKELLKVGASIGGAAEKVTGTVRVERQTGWGTIFWLAGSERSRPNPGLSRLASPHLFILAARGGYCNHPRRAKARTADRLEVDRLPVERLCGAELFVAKAKSKVNLIWREGCSSRTRKTSCTAGHRTMHRLLAA
ncbi:hypothetical protein ABIB73_007566 [Bradyrhizobium sp. F1.4.3]|uniref:helix-turn-helix domain-containing protein n=1 Tax=Bradyrhizobium sp. F1.4.3 TaxID=3156356 RepID=UPI0033925CDB